MIKLRMVALLLGGILLVISSCAKFKEVKLNIPSSTRLEITLSNSVQTNVNQTGEHFSGSVASPVMVEGKVAIPQGSKVDLVITKLVKGGTLKTPPEIAFTAKEITLPDGKTYAVVTNEIYHKGKSHTDREVKMIGGGAAAGAIVGGIIGKGKGAVIGAAAGAAVGTGAAAATGRENLELVPGQVVAFTLMQPLTVTITNK